MDSIEIFRSIPLFSDLNNQELTKLSRVCQKVSFKTGDRVFSFGDPGDALYIIREGGVEVRLPGDDGGDEQVIAKLGAGEIFGEMALFQKAPRSASIVADSDSRMFRIKREYFHKLIDENHDMAIKLYKRITVLLCNRLCDTTDRLAIANRVIKDSSK